MRDTSDCEEANPDGQDTIRSLEEILTTVVDSRPDNFGEHLSVLLKEDEPKRGCSPVKVNPVKSF